MIEQACQLLGFQIVGRFREIRDVGEENGRLLATRGNLDTALPSENR
jgi:hypothetical protein